MCNETNSAAAFECAQDAVDSVKNSAFEPVRDILRSSIWESVKIDSLWDQINKDAKQ